MEVVELAAEIHESTTPTKDGGKHEPILMARSAQLTSFKFKVWSLPAASLKVMGECAAVIIEVIPRRVEEQGKITRVEGGGGRIRNEI